MLCCVGMSLPLTVAVRCLWVSHASRVPSLCSAKPVEATQGVVGPDGAPTDWAVEVHVSRVPAVVRREWQAHSLNTSSVVCRATLSCYWCSSHAGLCRWRLLRLKWTELSKEEGGRCVCVHECVCVCVCAHV